MEALLFISSLPNTWFPPLDVHLSSVYIKSSFSSLFPTVVPNQGTRNPPAGHKINLRGWMINNWKQKKENIPLLYTFLFIPIRESFLVGGINLWSRVARRHCFIYSKGNIHQKFRESKSIQIHFHAVLLPCFIQGLFLPLNSCAFYCCVCWYLGISPSINNLFSSLNHQFKISVVQSYYFYNDKWRHVLLVLLASSLVTWKQS